MSRNHLKALGLALIAVVALSALTASAAQATGGVTTATYPAFLTGKDVNTKHGTLTRLSIGNGARFVECTKADLDATIANEGKKSTTTVTVEPTYENCFANGLSTVPATVTLNGCDFTLSSTALAVKGVTNATAAVMCPEGKQIQIHIYENEAQHKAGVSLCTYDIGPTNNQKLGKITIEPGAVGGVEDLTFKLAITEITTNSTIGAAGVCGIKGGEVSHGFSTLNGTYTVTGESDPGKVPQAIMME